MTEEEDFAEFAEQETCARCYSPLNHEAHEFDSEKLCDFCYMTHLGTILKYPDGYREQVTLATGLVQAFNMLQKQIQEKDKSGGQP